MSSADLVIARAQTRSHVKACVACDLHNHCDHPIAFSGVSTPKLVVVGETPNANEEAPFTDAAGALLRGWLKHVGWNLDEDVAFLNAVSCHPGRTPTPEEIAACRPNLNDQLSFLACDRILVVGGIAVSALTTTPIRMGEVRGAWFRPDAIAQYPTRSKREAWCYATWSPTAVLRNKELAWDATEDVSYMRLMMKYNKEPTRGQFCVKCGSPQVTHKSDIAFCGRHMPK